MPSGLEGACIKCPDCDKRVLAMKYFIYYGAQSPTAQLSHIERPPPTETPPAPLLVPLPMQAAKPA